MQFVGTPYVWGGNNVMEGLDCSGYTQVILRAAGLDPKGDQTSQGLYDHFRTEELNLNETIGFFEIVLQNLVGQSRTD